MSGAGIDRRLCLCQRCPRVGNEGDDPQTAQDRSITGRMFGTSGLIDIAHILPPVAAQRSSKSPKSPGIVWAPAPGTARNGPSR